MTNTEDSETKRLISEIITASANGIIDWQNIPEVEKIINQRVDIKTKELSNYIKEKYNILENQIEIPAPELTKKMIAERIDNQSSDVIKKLEQEVESKAEKQKQDTIKQLNAMSSAIKVMKSGINDVQQSKLFKTNMLIITTVVAIISSLSLIAIFALLFGNWFAIPNIWNFFNPSFSFLGAIKALIAILSIGTLFFLALYVIISPTRIANKFYKLIKKDTEQNEMIRNKVAEALNENGQLKNLMSKNKK